MTVSWLSDSLGFLGGADLDVLKRAKSERSTLIGLGLLMLGTASVAAVSMIFALRNAVLVAVDPVTGAAAKEQPTSTLIVAIILGLVWGALILVLDRALIKTMQGVAGTKAIGYAIPRIILAVVIGVVVSTPITIQIFHSEIAAQVKATQDADISKMKEDAANSQTAKDLAAVQHNITEREDILKGAIPGLSSPELEAAKERLGEAIETQKRAQTARDDAYLNMICEEDGAGALKECRGRASKKRGKGTRYLKRLDEYNTAERGLRAANRAVTTATTARDDAQAAANDANKDVVAKAQKQAEIDLCGALEGSNPPAPDPACQGGLRSEETILRQTLQSMQDGTLIRTRSGLLAQIVALGEITSRDSAANNAHIFVMLLFIIIELLPVFIKTLQAWRGVTQYDRIAKKLQDEEYESVESTTEAEQAQRDRETRKTEAIREDMVDREIALGKTANEHVAHEMETILSHALTDWSAKVNETLKSNPATPGSGRSSGGSTAPNHYGLPDGSQI